MNELPNEIAPGTEITPEMIAALRRKNASPKPSPADMERGQRILDRRVRVNALIATAGSTVSRPAINSK